jgi:hypothetical protein
MSASVPPALERSQADGPDVEVRPGGALRIARYSVYPRAANEHGVQTGVVRETADGRLVMSTSRAAATGELLRVLVHDHERDHDTLARVASCEARAPGRFELALVPLDARRPMRVRTHAKR